MARDQTRVNLHEAAQALREFLEDEADTHSQTLNEIATRNRGLWTQYVGRHRSLWSKLLGRLRESGMDSPEVLIGSAALGVVGAVLSFGIASRRR